jgi:hypothetical protein
MNSIWETGRRLCNINNHAASIKPHAEFHSYGDNQCTLVMQCHHTVYIKGEKTKSRNSHPTLHKPCKDYDRTLHVATNTGTISTMWPFIDQQQYVSHD